MQAPVFSNKEHSRGDLQDVSLASSPTRPSCDCTFQSLSQYGKPSRAKIRGPSDDPFQNVTIRDPSCEWFGMSKNPLCRSPRGSCWAFLANETNPVSLCYFSQQENIALGKYLYHFPGSYLNALYVCSFSARSTNIFVKAQYKLHIYYITLLHIVDLSIVWSFNKATSWYPRQMIDPID